MKDPIDAVLNHISAMVIGKMHDLIEQEGRKCGLDIKKGGARGAEEFFKVYGRTVLILLTDFIDTIVDNKYPDKKISLLKDICGQCEFLIKQRNKVHAKKFDS